MSQRYRDVLDYEIGVRIVVEFTTRGRDRAAITAVRTGYKEMIDAWRAT